jgi:carboxypeptidase Q
MRKTSLLSGPFLLALLPTCSLAQSPTSVVSSSAGTGLIYQAPTDVIEKIKDEGLNRSQVMTTLTYLTETFGPRLTGSPNLKAANDWTRNVMAGRGMEARLESWGPFGRGWTLKKFTAQIDKPYVLPLVAYPKAWTPSTRGEVTGEVVYFEARTEADFGRYRGKLRGKIVLMGQERKLKSIFEPLGDRRSDEDLEDLAQGKGQALGPTRPRSAQPAPTPAPVASATPSVSTTPAPAPTPPPRPRATPNRLKFLKDEGALVLMDNSSNGSNGTVFVANASVPMSVIPSGKDGVRRSALSAYDRRAEPTMLPQMTISSEHWNRLYRLVNMGQKPVVSLQITSQFHDEDNMAYNTIGDIPGTDLKNEVVMMGAHMDSWHVGTGATDNGCNVAVMMEAARIIQTLGIKPRRTIRVALWTGEEEGLLGSSAYVKAHFGEMKPGVQGQKAELIKKPEYEQLSAYYNLDNGSGKIRGIFSQENSGAAPIFAQWLKPFAALGAGTMAPQNTTSTDHIPFDRIGLPGFQFIQDNLDYWSQTHHSTQDVLERVQEDDIKFNAVVLAAFVWQTAMMDEKLPRKPLS